MIRRSRTGDVCLEMDTVFELQYSFKKGIPKGWVIDCRVTDEIIFESEGFLAELVSISYPIATVFGHTAYIVKVYR